MDLALSDHFCVYFEMSVYPDIQIRSTTVKKKKIINGHTSALFEPAFWRTSGQLSDSVDNLLNNFKSSICFYYPLESFCQCIDQINSWMSQNVFQLNDDKTELILFGENEESLRIAVHLDTKGLAKVIPQGVAQWPLQQPTPWRQPRNWLSGHEPVQNHLCLA